MEISLITPSFSITSSGAGGNYLLFMFFVLAWIFATYMFSGLRSLMRSVSGAFS